MARLTLQALLMVRADAGVGGGEHDSPRVFLAIRRLLSVHYQSSFRLISMHFPFSCTATSLIWTSLGCSMESFIPRASQGLPSLHGSLPLPGFSNSEAPHCLRMTSWFCGWPTDPASCPTVLHLPHLSSLPFLPFLLPDTCQNRS